MSLHLYLARPEVLDDPEREEKCRAQLTEEERARVDRYLRPEDRRLSLLARALCRNALSGFAAIAPEGWRFTANSYGRPEISERLAEVEGTRGLVFNLSHTRGMVALVVSRCREIGVDVEDLWRTGQTVDIAERFFAPREVSALKSLEGEALRRRFLEHWTLKESYIKARGMGLAIPLQKFGFALGGSRIGFWCDGSLGDNGSEWNFQQRAPTERHLVALAVRAPQGEELTWIEHDGTEVLP